MVYDLILRSGRVIDPSQTLDATMDVAFLDGKVAAIGSRLETEAGTVEQDVSGLIVTPGLLDLHTHVYWGGTSLGIDAEAFGRASGVTTVVDTGSAGPGNFAGFRQHVIEKSQVRILALLNVSFAGIYGYGSESEVGESEEIRLLSPVRSVEVIEANRDVIAGVKVRVGKYASGNSGLAPLDMALEVANETCLPLMAHIDFPPPSYEEVVSRLRRGDILTHAFRPFPNAPVNSRGAIRAAVREARERGVLFDIGHGQGSFAFKTARAMLAEGFQPDTISSDIHAGSIDGPVFDQTTTLSKFLCLGMSLTEVITASTLNAASALRRPELGSLKPGSTGDATILTLEEGSFDYIDCMNEVMRGDQRLVARGVVLNGRWWKPWKDDGEAAAKRAPLSSHSKKQ